MNKRGNLLKNLFKLIPITFLVITLSACTYDTEKAILADNDTNGELKMHFIDVGQGDCILVQQGKNNMVIDGGCNESEDAIKKYLQGLEIEKLDYVVGTHVNEDHIGSLDYIIDSYDIGKVYFPKQITANRDYQNFIESCKNKDLKLNAPNVDENFKLGEAECTFLSPRKDSYKDIYNSSIVLKIKFGNNSFLLTGDAGEEAEEEMLSSGVDLQADVLKIGHHGSDTATTDKFLEAVNPKYTVLSVGEHNSYELPNEEVMDKLKKKEIPVYRTDECENIVVTSYGRSITFNTVSGSYKIGSGR